MCMEGFSIILLTINQFPFSTLGRKSKKILKEVSNNENCSLYFQTIFQ